MENAEARMVDEQEIYLSDIIDALKRSKLLIFASVGLATLAGLLYAVFTTPLYTASVIARPLELEESGALGALSSQFGGAAALAGIDLGGGGSDRDEYLAILSSRTLGERFIAEHGVKPILFPDEWDAEAGAWPKETEPGLIGVLARGVSKALAAISGDEGWQERAVEPTLWQAYEVFKDEVFSVSEDQDSGLITISFKTRNPVVAARWANDYVAMANVEIRTAAVAESSRALDYLNTEVEKATAADLRDTIYRVIESELKKIMFANARPEYAFKVIDRAVVPEDRSHPKRALIVILSMFAGLSLGVFLALAKDFLGRQEAVVKTSSGAMLLHDPKNAGEGR